MHRSKCRYSLLAAILLSCPVWAASLSQTIPADSAFAKANPAWQRLSLMSMADTSKVGITLVPGDKVLATPAFDVPGKFAVAPMHLSINARHPGSKGAYAAGRVGGQAKLLGMWASLPADANTSAIGFQITDSEGENFIYTVPADAAAWKWIEADVTTDKFAPLIKPGEKDAKNGKIDFPLTSVRVAWLAKAAGVSSVLVDEVVAISDVGTGSPTIPLAVGDFSQMTLEPGGKLNVQVPLTNLSDKDLSAQVEFSIQEDPACYNKITPLPRYGNNVATGTHSWFELAGRTYDIKDAMTDGKPTTDFGGPMDKDGWAEAFAYIDLGKLVHVAHMGRMGGNASRIYKVDFSSSLDGKEYTPVEGLKNVDFFQKWEPSEIDVPHPFEARFIRMRIHNNGQKMNVYALPSEFYVYDGENKDTWAFPQAGTVLMDGAKTQAIAARNFELLQLGDGRALNPGSYILFLRTRIGDVTQLHYGRVLVMPPALANVGRESRFGMNGIEYPTAARRESYGWIRFENLKWPFVSPAPGVYDFTSADMPERNYDRMFKSYRDQGLFIMPYLFLSPGYLGKGWTNPPSDLSKYGEFVFQVVARYGSKKHPTDVLLPREKISGLGYVDTFELWNEPDLNDPHWGHWIGPREDYFKLFRYGAEAVKKADPDAKVANGGWSGMDVPLMETMRSYKYPDGKCPLDFADVLSVHYYSLQVAPELAQYNDNTNRNGAPLFPSTFEQQLKSLVAWRDQHKPAMPIYISETGYDTGGPKGVDERTQAAWLPRDLMMMLASGIDKIQVFRETGSGSDMFAASGVIRDDGSLKPSWFTYATLIRQLDGVTERAAKLDISDKNVRAYLWKKAGKSILTAWAIQGTGKLELPLGQCTVTDSFGLSRKVDAAAGLQLSEFPLYLTDLDAKAAAALDQQVAQAKLREQARVQRESSLQAYLFLFGAKDRNASVVVGKPRTFVDVLAADMYDPAKGYGFETKGLENRDERWLNPPQSVRVSPGAKFTFNAKPGEYVLAVSARPQGNSQVVIKGVEGGDQIVKLADGGATGKTTVKVGAKPVTVQSDFTGAMIWISMIEVDASKD